nr:hypothetical protein [Allomuricauda sp.]|tara:strand:+ start:696 stop:869 length:174 start_codon:yes stop_codon:yes gene_type:complete
MKSSKMTIFDYSEHKIKNPSYVFGGGDQDGPQETTSGPKKKRYRKHWWQFWLPREKK